MILKKVKYEENFKLATDTIIQRIVFYFEHEAIYLQFDEIIDLKTSMKELAKQLNDKINDQK